MWSTEHDLVSWCIFPESEAKSYTYSNSSLLKDAQRAIEIPIPLPRIMDPAPRLFWKTDTNEPLVSKNYSTNVKKNHRLPVFENMWCHGLNSEPPRRQRGRGGHGHVSGRRCASATWRGGCSAQGQPPMAWAAPKMGSGLYHQLLVIMDMIMIWFIIFITRFTMVYYGLLWFTTLPQGPFFWNGY